MGDLVVSYDVLESAARSVSDIKSVFEGLEASVSHRRDDWGDDDVADAMHEFSSNWGYHRVKLCDLLDSAAEKFEKTMSTFRDADGQLRDRIDAAVQAPTTRTRVPQ